MYVRGENVTNINGGKDLGTKVRCENVCLKSIGAVIPDLQGAAPFDAIRELCDAVAQQRAAGALDADALYAAVRAREELMGTAVGHEIAVPHARLPTLKRPVLTFGHSLHGIDWDAPDGHPVRLVFLVLTPELEDGLQLQILAAIAQSMIVPESRERLCAADTSQDAWRALEAALRAQDLVRVKLGS